MKRILIAALALVAGAAVAQQKPLVAGVDGTFAPHAMPKLGGGLEGFNVDMINDAAKRMHRKIEIFSGEFSGLIPSCAAAPAAAVCVPDRTALRPADAASADRRRAAARRAPAAP